MNNRYPFNIEWSEEDQEYVATCPAFPGLSAFGESEEEALREGKIALEGFMQPRAESAALDEIFPCPPSPARQTNIQI